MANGLFAWSQCRRDSCRDPSVPVHHEVRQEQIAAGETTRNIMENPTVLEQVIVQENSELQDMERIQEQIVESSKEILQDRVQQRTVEHTMRMPVPTVQGQMIVQDIPDAQVVERIQKQVAETIPQERVQQRTVEQNVCMCVATVREQMNVQESPGCSGCGADTETNCGDHSTGACSAALR